MSPVDLDTLWDQSRDGAPFSNSDEGIAWMDANCAACWHDLPAREGDDGRGCPLLLLALSGRTPAQWRDGPRRYVCTEFRHEDEGAPPAPPLPGQLGLPLPLPLPQSAA